MRKVDERVSPECFAWSRMPRSFLDLRHSVNERVTNLNLARSIDEPCMVSSPIAIMKVRDGGALRP
jgi:hypothetical protein